MCERLLSLSSDIYLCVRGFCLCLRTNMEYVNISEAVVSFCQNVRQHHQLRSERERLRFGSNLPPHIVWPPAKEEEVDGPHRLGSNNEDSRQRGS